MTKPPLSIPFARGRLSNDIGAFGHLAKLHHDIQAATAQAIIIDMSHVTWFDAHLSAPLKVIANHAVKSGKTIRINNIQPRIREILCKNRLLKQVIDDNFGTTIPVQSFLSEQAVEFSKYAKANLDRKEVPRMTERLKSRFFEGIDEIFANSSMHSKSPVPIVASGQFFPKVNRLDFCLADGGLGIQTVVNKALSSNKSASEAIDWAMTANNTTRSGDIPGGLGSQILRSFIEINEGKLYVISGDGVWVQEGTTVSTKRLPYSYPGTFAILEIDTSDTRAYDLVAAPDPRDIW
jgi:hypothetical protein